VEAAPFPEFIIYCCAQYTNTTAAITTTTQSTSISKPWEKPGSVGRTVLLWPMNEQCMIVIQAAL